MIIDNTGPKLYIHVTDLSTKVGDVMAAIERNTVAQPKRVVITLPSGQTYLSHGPALPGAAA